MAHDGCVYTTLFAWSKAAEARSKKWHDRFFAWAYGYRPGQRRDHRRKNRKSKNTDLYEAVDALRDASKPAVRLESAWIIRRRRIAVGLAEPWDRTQPPDSRTLAVSVQHFGDTAIQPWQFDVVGLDLLVRRAVAHLNASAKSNVVAWGALSWYLIVLMGVRIELDRRPLTTTAAMDDDNIDVPTPEILHRVIGHLGERDRRTARRVSRAWHRATCDPLLRPSGIVDHIVAAIDCLGGVRRNRLGYATSRELFLMAAVVQRWLG
jgi:hypothetical protein